MSTRAFAVSLAGIAAVVLPSRLLFEEPVEVSVGYTVEAIVSGLIFSGIVWGIVRLAVGKGKCPEPKKFLLIGTCVLLMGRFLLDAVLKNGPVNS